MNKVTSESVTDTAFSGHPDSKASVLSRYQRKVHQRLFRTKAQDALPHSITHERIYIVPTRRGWVFLLSLLLMLVGAINYNLSLGYALCFLLTGLFAASLLATYRNISGIEILRISSPESTLGNELPFVITFGNNTHIERKGIDVGNNETLTCFNLAAHNESHVTVNMNAIHRGLQPCGRLTISSDFPVGLWITWSYVHVDCKGLVFPRAELAPPPLPFDQRVSSQGLARSSTQGEFESLREYQPGDAMGSIAWKVAARGMGLFTRQFASESLSGELKLRWQETRTLSDTEQRLSRLAAWAQLATKEGLPFSLEMPGGQLSAACSENHLRSAMRLLALHGTN